MTRNEVPIAPFMPSGSLGAAQRRLAEQALRKESAETARKTVNLSAGAMRHTLSELRVRQIDLERHNEAPRRAQAPLDVEALRCWARAWAWGRRIGQLIAHLISPRRRAVLDLFNQRVMARAGARPCELRQLKTDVGLVSVLVVAVIGRGDERAASLCMLPAALGAPG